MRKEVILIMSFMIGRPIHGISLNGNEYVLGDDGKPRVFPDMVEAKQFLAEKGMTEVDIEAEGIVFVETEAEADES